MSASLIAKLQLDIAGFQAALAQSNRELANFKQRGVREVDQIGAAQKRLNQALKDTGASVPKINPWTTATVGSERYLEKLKTIAKEQKLMAQYQLHAAAKAGPSAANPWASGAPAYQRQLQEKETLRLQQLQADQQAQALAAQQKLAQAAAAAQQRAAMQAAAEASALQRKQVLETASQRHSNQATMDGRLQLQLIEARLAGNAKEVVQLEARMHLLNQMRQIQAQTGVSQREAYNLSQRMGASGRSGLGGGGRSFAMGNAAMQVQDIAVQMQMGTKASIILAQQGSQMLSVFGAGGAIAGGVLAIGGAFHTMRENALKAFNDTMKASRELASENELLVQSTTADNLATNLGHVQKELKGIDEQLKNLEHSDSQMSHLWLWLRSGGNPHDMQKQLLEARGAAGDRQGQMVDRALVNSKQQRDIAQLRALGKDEEADALERSIKLSEKLKAIDAMRIQDWSKDILKKNAAEESGFEAQKTARTKEEKETKKIEAAQEKLDEARQKAADKQMSIGKQIIDLRKRIAKPDEAAKDKESEIKAQTKKVELQITLNSLLEEQKRKQKDAAEAEKRRHEAAIKAYEDQKKRQADLSKSRNDSMMSMEVLRLRARGQSGNKKADKVERQARVRQYEAELLKQGASPEFAKQQAEEKAALEDKIARRESGLPGHIGGVRNKRGMGGGLDEFAKMNQKGWITPPALGYKNGKVTMKEGIWGNTYHPEGLSNRGTSQIPGRYMGGDGGSLSTRATRAAGAQDARETKDTSVVTLLQKSLDVLQKGLLG